jgi:hypothetical protein
VTRFLHASKLEESTTHKSGVPASSRCRRLVMRPNVLKLPPSKGFSPSSSVCRPTKPPNGLTSAAPKPTRLSSASAVRDVRALMSHM